MKKKKKGGNFKIIPRNFKPTRIAILTARWQLTFVKNSSIKIAFYDYDDVQNLFPQKNVFTVCENNKYVDTHTYAIATRIYHAYTVYAKP